MDKTSILETIQVYKDMVDDTQIQYRFLKLRKQNLDEKLKSGDIKAEKYLSAA